MIHLTTKDIHGSTTTAMKEVISEKFSFLEKVADIDSVKINIAREGKQFKSTALFDLSGKRIKVESSIEEDAYLSADILVNKVKEVVHDNRNKLKRISRIKSSGRRQSYKTDNELGDISHRIVRRKKFHTKPMTEDVAILEMEALGHDTFIFMNSEQGAKICMIYTRKAGGYGLIELE